MVGLLGRAALAVDRRGPHLEGEPGREPRVAGDVGGLLAGLGDAPGDDLLDVARVHPGSLDDLDLRGGEQLGGVQPRQPPVALADGRAGCFDDHGLRHVRAPSFTFIAAPLRAPRAPSL